MLLPSISNALYGRGSEANLRNPEKNVKKFLRIGFVAVLKLRVANSVMSLTSMLPDEMLLKC